MATNWKARKRAAASARYGFLIVFGLIMLVPLLFVLYVSVLPASSYPGVVAPTGWTFDNYVYVFQHAPIARWYLNTAIVTACVVAGAVIVNTLAGWALARFRFRGKGLIFLAVVAILMIPLQAYLIPLYLQVVDLGWLNTFQALIIPFLANPLLIFLMRQSFSTLPKELEEAAAIDGAGRFRTFLQIGVPLSVTAIATQAILSATWTWNGFLVPVTFTNDKDMFMLTVGLNSLQAQNYTLPTVQMAGVVLLTIPVVVMFLIFQRFIVPSLASTGIKG
ncbi:carbohydrate ABC transporter permease [Leifsonia sp. 21MFCrub1.1]|uniref:carbohydrate ABC transporter permease n=1 Tax=Leifsonia sp. 21MFCrub1.1 TaxID=1798223 RepID=UPI0008929860|nr:carbohydrate ABC transporter permease [Leifsonia sp. 21MFCrub1.1]SEB08812.1 carbohydrate ABC transporter membrane protein 2, CUT1 family [Leifsonia sp. 21MFCrub1.1]